MESSKLETNKELILEVLRDGRKRWTDLERKLVKTGKMSKPTLSSNLKDLQKSGMIKRMVDDTKRPAVWYMLAKFHLPIERKVKNVVEKLRHEYRFLREPTVKEVSIKVGKVPETIRSLLYELAPETGWKEEENKQVKEEAEESINLAAWMKWLRKGDESREYSSTQINELDRKAKKVIESATPEVIKKARDILKNYPELLPKARPREVSPSVFILTGLDPWPEETKRVWRYIFREKPPSSGRPVGVLY